MRQCGKSHTRGWGSSRWPLWGDPRQVGHDKHVHGDIKQMLLPRMACGLERLASCRRYSWAGDVGLASAQHEGSVVRAGRQRPMLDLPCCVPFGRSIRRATWGPHFPSRSCWGYPKLQNSLCIHPKPTSTSPPPMHDPGPKAWPRDGGTSWCAHMLVHKQLACGLLWVRTRALTYLDMWGMDHPYPPALVRASWATPEGSDLIWASKHVDSGWAVRV